MRRSPHTSLTLLLVVVALVASSCGRRLRGPDSESNAPALTTTTTLAPDAHGSTVTTPPPSGLAQGVIDTPDGRERTYHVYAPTSVGTDPLPLLIALHGGTGWGLQFRDNSGFDALAEEHGFIVVYPDGISIFGDRDQRVWNGGACCGPAEEDRRNVDDVTFISLLVDELATAYPIDAGRVFATGHSNGAIMSYRLGCELADTVTAIAFYSGSIEIDECRPSQPVAVLHVHGLADDSIRIDGGVGDRISNHEFASPLDSIAHMAEVNGCTGEEEVVDPSNADVSGTRWTGCTDDAAVELMLIEGANHAWPGHDGTWLQERFTGEPYPDLDASRVIWDFLSTQSR